MSQPSGVEGYTTSVGTPPKGDLPHTGADLGGPVVFGAGLLFIGAMILAAVNGWRTAHATPEQAPDYLRNKAGGQS